MPFQDLAAFIAPGFELPVRGKTYRVSAPSARDGLYLQAIIDTGETLAVSIAVMRAERKRSTAKRSAEAAGVMSAANREILSDEEERTAFQIALGAAYREMVDDGLEWPIVKHAGMTAVLYWTRDEATAERYWSRFGQGKATEPRTTSSPTSGATSPEDPSTQSPA